MWGIRTNNKNHNNNTTNHQPTTNLLFISGQVPGVRPNEVEKAVRDVGRPDPGVEFLEKARHLADEALVRRFTHFANVLVRCRRWGRDGAEIGWEIDKGEKREREGGERKEKI